MTSNGPGSRIRRLRLIAGHGQVEFARLVGIANGSVSKLENDRMPLSEDLLDRLARVLDCTPEYLISDDTMLPTTRPWLRAYADASKRVVDRQLADCLTAVEVIERLDLKRIPDTVPAFRSDPSDLDEMEQFALEVRAAAGLDESDPVGNTIRAAERLGCLVLPMRSELGRHLGLSARASLTPVICISRPFADDGNHVPGDRQRFTIAHELGHLTLHGMQGPPETAEDAARVEREAHRFAGAFLAPGEAMLDALRERGGRVTLNVLADIKRDWGIAIKALVIRFQNLGVIEADQARSLYKQISARGWNTGEPVPVGNEEALWFQKALRHATPAGADPATHASAIAGVGRSHFARWTHWVDDRPDAEVISMSTRLRPSSARHASRKAQIF